MEERGHVNKRKTLSDRISVVVRLLWLSGRALAVQARGVLGLTPGDHWPFHFPPLASKFLYYQREARFSEHVYFGSTCAELHT